MQQDLEFVVKQEVLKCIAHDHKTKEGGLTLQSFFLIFDSDLMKKQVPCCVP